MVSLSRRDVLRLGTAGLAGSIAGCSLRSSGESTPTSTATRTPPPSGTATPTDTATTTDTPTATDAATPAPGGPGDCEWPDMCEGSQIVQVTVSAEFSGDVVLHPDCRDEEFAVEPGDSVGIGRQVDGEECAITLTADGETVHSETVEGHEQVTLTVTADGDVQKESVVQ